MTAIPAARTTQHAGAWHVAMPAIISVGTLIVLTVVVDRTWGDPQDFPTVDAYRHFMDAVVLLRVGPAFLSALIVWPAMRLRGASIGWAAVGALSSAVVFGLLAAVQALTFFPPAQAAYYAINPMVVGAVGSQIGCSVVGELFVRWRRGGASALGSWRLWAACVPVAAVGFSLFYVGIIWDGGRHWFYVWIQGFSMLFGTGQ